jgi:4-hydroxy-tetrahydrodipicolinate synthase
MNQNTQLMEGVLAPVATPFRRDLDVDEKRFVSFCKWLVSQGAGLAIFGTNSEANSLSLAERRRLLDCLIGNGVDPKRMMPGVGCCSIEETVELASAAVKSGCGGVLMLPPFFYKGVSDDGLFDYYARVIERVADSGLRLYLYHIPQVSGVPISLALVGRLLQTYPGTVVGLKDSSGDWANTKALLNEFPGFRVFPASESLLIKALPLGAAGCISATANLQPAAIANLIASRGSNDFIELHQKVSAVRSLLQKYPMIPALKRVIATWSSDATWNNLRPPLVELPPGQVDELLTQLRALDFRMPNLDAVVI